MGTSVLDERPTPVADKNYFPECRLAARCTRCAHGAALPINDLIRWARLPKPMPIYRVGERLRCRVCGARGRVLGVEGWSRW